MMTELKIIWFCFLLLLFSAGFAQGDDNLLMQYNQGPDLDAFYRKWNFDLHTRMLYGNATEDYSFYKISYSAGFYIQYKLSKTFAFVSGADYYNIRYQYNLVNNQSYDQLTYLSIPMTIRVFPSRKLLFETGLLYNYLLKAINSEIINPRNQSNDYPDGVFKNTFGWVFGVQYNVWKRFDVSLQYRFSKRASDNGLLQKNNFEAFLLGIHFFVLNPKEKPK